MKECTTFFTKFMGAVFIRFTRTKGVWIGGVFGEGAVEVGVIEVLAFEWGDTEEGIHAKENEGDHKSLRRRSLKS